MGGHLRQERTNLAFGDGGAGRVVGGADQNQAGAVGDSCRHGVQVVRAVGQVRHLHAASAHDADKDRVRLEGTPGVDDFVLHAVSVYAGESFEDLVERAEASGTGDDVVSVHAQSCGELLTQGGGERVGVAVRGRKFCEDARDLGYGAQRVLIGGELVLGEAFDGCGRLACRVAGQGVEDGADRNIGVFS